MMKEGPLLKVAKDIVDKMSNDLILAIHDAEDNENANFVYQIEREGYFFTAKSENQLKKLEEAIEDELMDRDDVAMAYVFITMDDKFYNIDVDIEIATEDDDYDEDDYDYDDVYGDKDEDSETVTF